MPRVNADVLEGADSRAWVDMQADRIYVFEFKFSITCGGNIPLNLNVKEEPKGVTLDAF
jgi:hypothetical protein